MIFYHNITVKTRIMYLFIKRFLDIILSIVLLMLLSPLLILVMLLIFFKMGSPVFFKQKRIGKENKPFAIIKFRTMINNSSMNLSDKQRLTKLGALLRKMSIDELPQLINIVKGDMSFIGPRPLLEEYLLYYNNREIKRHQVRPGMTSLASIKGRSYITWEDQFEMDVNYVENLSFCLDFKIFCKTIPKVLGSVDMMVTGRIDKDSFNIHRQKQIASEQKKIDK